VVQRIGGRHDPDVAVADALHLGVDVVSLFLEFFEPFSGSVSDCWTSRSSTAKMLVSRDWVATKIPAPKTIHPADNVLRSGGEVVARFVLPGDVVLPEPGPFGGGPVVEVLCRLARKLVLAVGIPQAEEDVVQAVDELLPAEVPLVGAGEGGHEKRDGERGVLGAQQGPACMVLTQGVDCVVVHRVLRAAAHTLSVHSKGHPGHPNKQRGVT
jgi:hypothetical protein